MANSTGNNIDNATSSASNASRQAGRAVSDVAGQVTSDLKQATKDLRNKAGHVYENAASVVQDQMHNMREQGMQAIENLEGTITRKPLTSIAIALGSGIVFGLALTSMFRSRS